MAGARTDVLEASGSGSVAFTVGLAGLSDTFPAVVCGLSQVLPSSELESIVADQMVRADAVQLGEDPLLGVVAGLAEAGGGAAGQVLGLWLTGSDSL